MPGHSPLQEGVALLATTQASTDRRKTLDRRVKPGDDDGVWGDDDAVR